MTNDMEAASERPVLLRGPEGKNGTGEARIIERSAAWRRAAALKQLGWWLLALVSVFIPVAHFFLVPMFLAVGAFGAWSKLSERATLVSLHGTCPHCGTEQDFNETGRVKPNHKVTCRHCRWDLHLEPAPQPA